MSYLRASLLTTGFVVSSLLTYHSFCEYQALAVDHEHSIAMSSLELSVDDVHSRERQQTIMAKRSSTAQGLMIIGGIGALVCGLGAAAYVHHLKEQAKYRHL